MRYRIAKKIVLDRILLAAAPLAVYERVGIPRWLVDEKNEAAEKRARDEGLFRSGLESVEAPMRKGRRRRAS